MTPKQFNEAILALGLSQGQAAKFLRVSLRTINGYANGTTIPESTAKLLRLMLRLKLKPADVK